jgi:hypothetical protein
MKCDTRIHISLGSNIQFSTNTEKEQVIIKKNCNNEQIEFLFCVYRHLLHYRNILFRNTTAGGKIPCLKIDRD